MQHMQQTPLHPPFGDGQEQVAEPWPQADVRLHSGQEPTWNSLNFLFRFGSQVEVKIRAIQVARGRELYNLLLRYVLDFIFVEAEVKNKY
jgi:hypothetical protein